VVDRCRQGRNSGVGVTGFASVIVIGLSRMYEASLRDNAIIALKGALKSREISAILIERTFKKIKRTH
jgi:hypothetical protein